MEQGAYSITLKGNGYANNVTNAYIIHVIFFFAGVYLCSKIKFLKLEHRSPNTIAIKRIVYSRFFLIILFSLIIVWFGFGGIKVMLGGIDKAQFRTSLGPFGALMYLLVKSIVPTLLAYYACLVKNNNNGYYRLYLICIISSFLALGLGFKALSITIVLPAFFILKNKLNLLSMMKYIFISVGVLFSTAYIFKDENTDILGVLEFVFERATIIQGDVAWYVWNSTEKAIKNFELFKTLYPAIGESNFALLTGVTQSNYDVWVDYHFAQSLTRFVGYDNNALQYGFTVTGNVFSTAVFALGKQFFWIYSFFVGSVSAIVYKIFIELLNKKYYKLASVIASFMAFSVIGWINSGEIIKLFHISTIFYLIFSYLLLCFLEKRLTWNNELK
ncbi:hypothetical protein AYJ58_16795 [Shewanella sp. Pdp11]|uniref:hypothetical protein n=1 Tax=Shewanella sp. Pdp11 TaxID=2059264 RepID=UPI000CA2C262|nr:hypothetical protein [Shewanella sp. Pdp11]AUD61025.1 hypothetical protein AYJ58_16795 [Shewanella sp. Pdp11]